MTALEQVTTDSGAAATASAKVDFYFDPVCPWAWRTSLWIREVAKVRPINIHWKFLSLEYINSTREGGHVRDSHRTARDGFKLMTLEWPEQVAAKAGLPAVVFTFGRVPLTMKVFMASAPSGVSIVTFVRSSLKRLAP